ncbi:MAG: glycosyltransferase [Saprospiraceae bacterium]|nr:glycosyltransferase [Saprospiraceae bacterium]
MKYLSKAATHILFQNITMDDTVIIAPLNWGLGHAARCIPIIHHLKTICKKVIIASDGQALELLQKEFQELTSYELPGYKIKYRFDNMIINIILQLPAIIMTYWKENHAAKNIVKQTKATIIISDSRFGFRATSTKNIYLSHQINILHSNQTVAYIANKLHLWVIRKFDDCWIPDYGYNNALAGSLSNADHLKKKSYIGPVTRIIKMNIPLVWDICVLLSGPEPQRSVLEQKLIIELKLLTSYKILFVRGINDPDISSFKLSHVICKGLLTSDEISTALNSSRLLIARSGYTTVMDIESLDIQAIFIPTPGQTEQEYLASRLSSLPRYSCILQSETSKLKKLIPVLLS